MKIRKPIVAGQFYPGQHDTCVDEVNLYLDEAVLTSQLPQSIAGGIVPHAGWTFSGTLAMMVFSAIQQRHDKVNTFVIFGAAHSFTGSLPMLYQSGIWNTPLGDIAIDEELGKAVIQSGTAVGDFDAHSLEHSIEVQVPFIQYMFPGAKILPVIVPPAEQAIALGQAVGEIIKAQQDKKIVCIGSTDLTHYGPRYGFTPMGSGPQGIKWATEVNDQSFIDLALELDPQAILSNAAENRNACGPGAAAATIAAAKKLGRTRGVLLAHTNSNEVMLKKMAATSEESVGYAAIVF